MDASSIGERKSGALRQILGEGIVGQKAEPMRIAAADIHVTRVVPTLRGVFQQIDGADRKVSLCTTAAVLLGVNTRPRTEACASFKGATLLSGQGVDAEQHRRSSAK